MGRYALLAPYTGNTTLGARKNSWTDDASCRGMDPEIFEVGLTDELLDGEIDPVSWVNMQRDRMIEAKKTCDGCPVKTECRQEATNTDSSWTMRGGVDPVSSRLWKDAVRSKLPEGMKLCGSGRHEMTPENVNPSGRCRACKNGKERDRKGALREAKLSPVVHLS